MNDVTDAPARGTRLVPRPGILSIAPYVGGEFAIAGQDRVIKLASNEYAPRPLSRGGRSTSGRGLRRAPLPRRRLRRPAPSPGPAARLGRGADRLRRGLRRADRLLPRAYAGPGDSVLYSRHGFLMYPIAAQAAGATPVAAPERALTADVDATSPA